MMVDPVDPTKLRTAAEEASMLAQGAKSLSTSVLLLLTRF